MPARKKAPGTQQDHRPQRTRVTALAIVEPASTSEIPAVPRPHGGLLKSSLEAWDRFWTSMLAGTAIDVDFAVAERWVLARDEWQRAMNGVRRARVVEGSTGQPVLNPLTSWVASREAVMEKCERQLGIGPKFRMDLGIAVGQARMTAAEVNRMTEEIDAGHEEGEAELDEDEAWLAEEFGSA